MSEKYFTRFASKNSIRSYMFQYQKIKICEIYQNIKKQIIRDKKFSSLQYLSQQTFVLIKTVLKTSWRGLPSSYSRCLQNVLIKTDIFVLAIRLQDVFKAFWRHFQDVLPPRLQNVLQKCLQDVFKTSF